jgi:hypothetical protein
MWNSLLVPKLGCARLHPVTAAKRFTWHDGPLWEVTVKELVIDCDVLVANSILAILNLHNPVNQEEWVPASRVSKDMNTLKQAPSCYNSPTGR